MPLLHVTLTPSAFNSIQKDIAPLPEMAAVARFEHLKAELVGSEAGRPRP